MNAADAVDEVDETVFEGQYGFANARITVRRLADVISHGVCAESAEELVENADKAIRNAQALLKELIELRAALPKA